MLSVIGSLNLAPAFVWHGVGPFQLPVWHPHESMGTTTVASFAVCVSVIALPNEEACVASKPMLGKFPGAGAMLLYRVVEVAAGAANTDVAGMTAAIAAISTPTGRAIFTIDTFLLMLISLQ